MIRKTGKRKWSVKHCHGPRKGRTIGTHSTKKKALRQHRAIKRSQAKRRGKR